MKAVSTEKRWKDAITPLTDYVRDNRGALARLCEELTRRTGKTWHRNVVSGWLALKNEPAAGIGMVLVEISRAWTRRK